MEALEVRSPNQLARTIIATACTAVLFLLVWYAWEYLLLAFAGLLLAIVLQTVSGWIAEHTGWGAGLSYLTTLLALFAVIAIAMWFIAPRAIYESGQVAAAIPQSLEQGRDYANRTKWGHYVVEVVQRGLSSTSIATQVTAVAKGIMGAVSGFVVVLVIGFYAALNPTEYTGGLLRLMPERYRSRATDVARQVVYTLRWWLLGQMVVMIVLGVASMIALWVLHVPLAFTLGLFTGLMIFIPYVGAVISAVPAVLVALQRSPHLALTVVIVYVCIHSVEGYVLTPMVQKRAVRLPPILTISAQLVMWMISGLLGVAVATPLAAAALVLVKTLYLNEPVER